VAGGSLSDALKAGLQGALQSAIKAGVYMQVDKFLPSWFETAPDLKTGLGGKLTFAERLQNEFSRAIVRASFEGLNARVMGGRFSSGFKESLMMDSLNLARNM
jgi:hypothetical protein